MKKNYFLLLLITLLVNFSMLSQSIDIYGLNKKFTKTRMLRFKTAPNVYSIYNKQITYSKETKVKKRYLNIKRKLKSAEAKELVLKKKYETKMNRYNSVNSIVSKIKDFLSSKLPFEKKKSLLKEAQQLAIQNNITEKIYADSTINQSFKARFLVYSLNQIDLKIYLRRVVSKISQSNVKPESFPQTQEIKILREKLKKIKPYMYVDGPAKMISLTKSVLGERMARAYDLVGDFRVLSTSYLMISDYEDKFKKGQLIEKDLVDKLMLIEGGYTKDEPLLVIKSIDENKTYTVEENFFKEYGYTFDGKFRYQVKAFLADNN